LTEEHKSSLFDLQDLKRNDGINAGDILAVHPQLYDKYQKYIARTVKHDKTTRNLDFLTGLSAYTPEPINTFLRGESSIGKTYVTIQSLQFFHKDDVWLLGGLSPTALVHDKGELVDKSGEPLVKVDKPGKDASQDEKDAYFYYRNHLRDARYLVDLRGKILVFLEAPNIETFNKLRPILSHDCPEISYKFTDKELQSKHVVLRGWPAAIFCSTDEKFVQDLATRSFTFTPEISEVKIKDSNKLTGSKAAIPWKFEDTNDFMLLEGYLSCFKNMMSETKAIIPYAEKFAEQFPGKFPRSMRDFKHLLGLIQVKALFHYAQRPVLVRTCEDKTEVYVLASKEDYSSIMELWHDVRETTETSAASHIIKFYHEVVEEAAKEKANGESERLSDYVFTVKELTDLWNSKFSDRKSSDSIRNWVDFLCQIGYMTKEPNPEDKRENLLRIIKNGTENDKSGKCTESSLSAFFSLESFKEWLNEANQITEKTHVVLRENFLSKVEATPEQVYEKFYRSDLPQNSIIGLSSSEASLLERTEKKTDNQEIGYIRNLEDLINKIEKLERLEGKFEDKCVLCAHSGPMDYQATFHDQTWALLCGACGIRVCERLSKT
jgi:hypothetical protein